MVLEMFGRIKGELEIYEVLRDSLSKSSLTCPYDQLQTGGSNVSNKKSLKNLL